MSFKDLAPDANFAFRHDDSSAYRDLVVGQLMQGLMKIDHSSQGPVFFDGRKIGKHAVVDVVNVVAVVVVVFVVVVVLLRIRIFFFILRLCGELWGCGCGCGCEGGCVKCVRVWVCVWVIVSTEKSVLQR
jgi:hypothetical protein